jgi:hypothetical protein
VASEAVKAVRSRAAARFIGRPGVTGVGIGAKVVDGRPTGQIAVTVFVQEKRPREQVPADELIPPEVEGVVTDVLVLRDFQLVAEPPGARFVEKPVDAGRHRPIMGGLEVRGGLTGTLSGSIGCILLDRAGDPAKVYALTCHHVVARIQIEADITGSAVSAITVLEEPIRGETNAGQPNPKDCSSCCPGIFGTYADGAEAPEWDAAVLRLDAGIDYRCDIRGLSVPATQPPGADAVAVAGVAPMPTDAQLANHSYLVRKHGMMTGITGGWVVAAHCDIVFAPRPNEPPGSPERTQATDVLIVAPHPNPQVPAGEHPHFVIPGDSGSVTVDTANRVLGLNFLRCTGGAIRKGPQPLPTNTYFGVLFPIETVLSKFRGRGLDLVVGTASAPGQTRTVPGRPTVTSQVDGESVVVALPQPDEVANVRAPLAVPANAERLAADLEASATGQELLAFWHTHSPELRRLVNRDRRVAAVWHRSGASAVYHILLRGLDAGDLRVPATVNGRPLQVCLDALHAALGQSASETLRRDLDRLHAALPDLAGLGYQQFLAALSGEELLSER